MSELENVEKFSDQLVLGQNSNVYAKDVPLAQAKAIQGLRAVFDEVANVYYYYLLIIVIYNYCVCLRLM